MNFFMTGQEKGDLFTGYYLLEVTFFTGDCLLEVTTWAGVNVHTLNHSEEHKPDKWIEIFIFGPSDLLTLYMYLHNQ